jgi:pilus assembly protein Flp/PilA
MLATRLYQLLLDEDGVTFIEYSLIGALIAVVCVVAIGAAGTSVLGLFTAVCNEAAKAAGGAANC